MSRLLAGGVASVYSAVPTNSLFEARRRQQTHFNEAGGAPKQRRKGLRHQWGEASDHGNGNSRSHNVDLRSVSQRCSCKDVTVDGLLVSVDATRLMLMQ